MITYTETKTINQFTDGKGNIFIATALFSPNEENDTWIKYYNNSTKQEYECRYEAFLSRFSPIPD